MKCLALTFLACVLLGTNGCRTAYYAGMEKFGVYKRDLLKKRVVEARDEQKEAGEQFTDALTRLKKLYSFDGGDLEKIHRGLQSDYERSSEKANEVRTRVKEVETVANDLFVEWEKEIQEISTPSLRDRSRQQLRDTKEKYQTLHTALKRAEQSMAPVLVQLRDHVLVLKHNLNAQAIASLRGEATSIQTDISKLIDEMNTAIRRADEFIKAMP